MLFHSSIRRELARNFGATLVVLVTIVMTIVLIRTLGQASRGAVNPQDVMLFMAYSVLGRLPTLLALALFIAIVSTLSRMYRDSEMVVWFASGQGLAIFLRPLFRFAWPILVVIGLMAIFVWPWSNQQNREMQDRYAQRSDLDRVAPGQFQESSRGNRVFFIDRSANTNGSSNPEMPLTDKLAQGNANVFIATTDIGKSSTTTARGGRIEMRPEGQFLLLEDGQRLEKFTPSTSTATKPVSDASSAKSETALRISEFKQYGARIGANNLLGETEPQAKLLSTRELVKVPIPANMGELAWRLGLILAAVNLVVMAVALASVNPRGGRSGNLLLALLAFVVYNNLINLGQNWIFVGRVGFAELLLVLHGGVLILGLAWLAKRHYNWSFGFTLQSLSGRRVASKAKAAI